MYRIIVFRMRHQEVVIVHSAVKKWWTTGIAHHSSSKNEIWNNIATFYGFTPYSWIKAKISLVYLKFRKIRAFFNVYTFGIRFLLKFFKYPVPCYPDYLPFENCYHKIKFRWSAQTRRKHSTFFHKVVFRIYYILWLNKKISDSRMAVPNPLLILYICSYAWLPVLLFLSNFSVAPATGARSISILGLWWEPPTKEEILIKHFARRFSQFITEMKWIQWLVRLRIWDAHQNVVLNILRDILFIMLLGGSTLSPSWPKVGRWYYNGSVLLDMNPIISARDTTQEVSPGKYGTWKK